MFFSSPPTFAAVHVVDTIHRLRWERGDERRAEVNAPVVAT